MERAGALCCALALAGVTALSCAGWASARQNSVTGGIGVGYNFWDRTYDDEVIAGGGGIIDDDEGDRRDYRLNTEIVLQSAGIHDTLSFSYAPVLVYDDLDSETDIDHYLNLDWDQQWSRNWNFRLSDVFIYSSDPTVTSETLAFTGEDAEREGEPDPGSGVSADNLGTTDQLSQNVGNRRYWTNNLNLVTSYSYAADSDIEFGYLYRVLRNDNDDETDAYDEYDRHNFNGVWSHRYTPSWRTVLGGGYVKGLFDEAPDEPFSQDLQEYRIVAEAEYSRGANNSFPLEYRYLRSDYEDLRDDVWGHEGTLKWDYVIDSRNRLVVGGGPTYADSDRLDGDWRYNAHFNYVHEFQHGTIGALLDKRLLSQNFTGSGDTGLTDTTDIRLDFNYQYTAYLSFDIFALYRYEEILNPEGQFLVAALAGRDPATEADIDDVTYDRDTYSAGVSMNYQFWRWYTAAVSYVYYQQEGDVATDAYDDHRVLLTLTARKVLWQ